MQFYPFLTRFRRFHAPLGMLLVFLQRTPVLRLALPGAEYALSATAGHVLRCAFGLAAMGAYNSVAGATTFTVISAGGTATGGPAATIQINGTVGTPINGTTGVTFSVSGAPVVPKSFGVTDDDIGDIYSDTLPPGLEVNPLSGFKPGGAPFYNTNLKLTIKGTPTDSGTYRVRLWAAKELGLAGSGSELEAGYIIAKFVIADSGVTETAPLITTQPAGLIVTVGSPASFTVAASGNPAPTFQWKKNGANIPGATAATYSISSAVVGDAANYTVVATNSVGSVTSAAASLEVTANAVAPLITTQPVSQIVITGGSVAFTVAASGSPTPTFQWKKGGVNIAGAIAATYTIASVVSGDAGSYTAVATSSAGTATSSAATLTVIPAVAPSITAQPQSVTVLSGGVANFSVTANGTPAPTYQWKKNGVVINGATSSVYTVNPALAANAGSYTVVATNSAGSVTSAAAVLTVMNFPPGDFNRDGHTDILLENFSSGDHGLWVMNGTVPSAWITLPSIALNWRMTGRGDFNGDGHTDILWENVGSGDRGLWIMNGTVPSAWINLPSIALNWRIAGAGDFNADGQTDILWENVGSGDRGMWIMNGTVPSAWINLPSIALNWRIVGTGDFNGDGQADILWENVGSGDRGLWIMAGTIPAAWINLPSIALNWRIVGTGDFNGDSQTDILWENVGSGDRGMWIMNGTVPTAWINLPALDLNWHIAP